MTAAATEERPVRSATAEEAAAILEAASSVIVVPGYGMAVAQAQHKVRELYDALSRRGLPNPFRYPGVASTLARRSYRRRPKTSSTSSSKSCCSNRWTPCRANASRFSQIGLDFPTSRMLLSFMAGVSFPGVSTPVDKGLTGESPIGSEGDES